VAGAAARARLRSQAGTREEAVNGLRQTKPALPATTVLALLVVTAVAELVHGSHPGADDAATLWKNL